MSKNIINFAKKIKTAKKLKNFYKSERPDLRNIGVSKVQRLTGGISHKMYSFLLKYSDGVKKYSEEFVIRMCPPGDDAANMCKREFKILRCLAKTKIPVPYPHFMQLDNNLFGMPFLIMDKVYGKTLLQKFNSRSEPEMLSYFDQFVKLLVDLHSLDFHKAGLDFMNVSTPPYGYADMCLHELEQMLEPVDSEYANLVYEWLLGQRNNSACRHYVFIHGDFHPGNVIVKDNRIVALIDWEAARVGDAVSDLGWASFLIEVFGDEDEIRDYFLEKHHELTHASLRNLKFYEVRTALLFRLMSSLIEKYKASEIGMSQEVDDLLADTRLLDKIDRFIEERVF